MEDVKVHPEARLILEGKEFSAKAFLVETFSAEWLNEIQLAVAFWLGEQTFMAQKSSGSTGSPKPIKLQRKVLEHSARATLNFFRLQPKSSAVLFLPCQFIGGKMMVFRALIGGLHLYLFEPKSTLPPLQKAIDFVALTPMQAADSDVSKCRNVLLGGAPVSSQIAEKLKRENAAIFHGYGMTETASHIALRAVNGANPTDVYTAMPGVFFTQDERGCLVINAPDWGAIKMVTNDVVQLDSETEFTWRGRADFVINSGGVKIFPEEVEKALSQHISAPFFIAGVPDQMLGEKLILVVESPKEVAINFGELPKLHRPKKVFFIPKFSYTASQKINRSATLNLLKW